MSDYPQDNGFEPQKKTKSQLPLIIGITLAVMALGGIGVALIFNLLSNGAASSPSPSVPASATASEAPSHEAEASGGALSPDAGIYPAVWGAEPALPYQTVNPSKTDADVLADLKSKLRMDTFVATDTEILNVTKSFCYAYEKGESWNKAAVQFMILGDKDKIDSNASNLAYNVNLMGYAGAHFYCPKYEDAIKQELLNAQK